MACAPNEFDPTRKVTERGTLGLEVYKLFEKDFLRENPRRAEGFSLARDEMVGAVDHLFRPDELAAVQKFMVGLLPLYDDATVPDVTRRLAGVAERLTRDPEAMASLTALANREGYVSLPHQECLFRLVAKYPRYKDLVTRVINLTLEHDGLDENGAPIIGEEDSYGRLMKSLSEKLATLELSEDAERDIVLVSDLLTREDARLSGGVSLSPTGYSSIAARDVRGMAMVAPVSGSRGMPAPFVDMNPIDGLADVDASGRFVDVHNAPIDLPPFGKSGARDATARAVAMPNGPLMYQYVELDRTLLGGLMRDTRIMLARDVPTKALDTFQTFLGTRDGSGKYITAGNKLLDLAYAGAVSMEGSDLPNVVEITRLLLEQQEETLGYLLQETERQMDVADAHPVSLVANNTMFNDLLRVTRKILAAPGFAEELLHVMEDPRVLGLSSAAIKLMQHKHPRITEADFTAGRVFTTLVDRSRPDAADNQSLQLRLWHLIHDTRHARYEPRFIGVPLGFIFEIEDQAQFYMESIIGKAEIPSLVSTLTGLSTRPTPEELAVFLNSEQSFGNPQGIEGIDVLANDGDTLYAASASGMVDALRPLVQLFYDRGQMDLLFELFDVLYIHWPSPEGGVYQSTARNQPRYAVMSGVARYEPMLIDIFQSTHLVDGLQNLLIDTRTLAASSGKPARDVLLGLGRKLLNKDMALTTRDGRREVIVDGERITPLSPLDLLRAARSDIHAVIRRSNKSQQDWDAIVDTLHELFLKTRVTGPTAARFDNGRMIPVVTEVLRFAEGRAKKRAMLRTLNGWLTGEFMRHLDDAVTSDELPALLDMIRVVRADEDMSGMMIELRDQLMAEDQGFPELLAMLGDGLQASRDAQIAVPALRFFGKELAPEKGLMFSLSKLTNASLARDPEQRILETIRRAIEEKPDGGLYMSGLAHAIRQANRQNPVATTAITVEDTRLIVAAVARYLRDEEHGLEKFYQMVANRLGPTP